MSDDEDAPAETPPKKRKSLLGQDLDTLVILVKRAAAVGAVLGYLRHLMHC